MSNSASGATREDELMLLNAYLDNELDSAAVLDVERRLASDENLKAEYERLAGLKTALATHLVKDRASPMLRERIAAIAAPARPAAINRPMPRAYDWKQLAAAAAIACFVSSGATYLALRQAPQSIMVAELVAGHQRALLGAAPFDVASSDRHTVKPWFDSKLALSPKVVDLSSSGFPLAGGRADVVGGKAVPVMVYNRRAHVISVVAVPQPGSVDSPAAPAQASRDGYTVLTWNGSDFRYSAISDVAADELKDFVSLWRAAN
jgi:anti-sigma factor RsiW